MLFTVTTIKNTNLPHTYELSGGLFLHTSREIKGGEYYEGYQLPNPHSGCFLKLSLIDKRLIIEKSLIGLTYSLMYDTKNEIILTNIQSDTTQGLPIFIVKCTIGPEVDFEYYEPKPIESRTREQVIDSFSELLAQNITFLSKQGFKNVLITNGLDSTSIYAASNKTLTPYRLSNIPMINKELMGAEIVESYNPKGVRMNNRTVPWYTSGFDSMQYGYMGDPVTGRDETFARSFINSADLLGITIDYDLLYNHRYERESHERFLGNMAEIKAFMLDLYVYCAERYKLPNGFYLRSPYLDPQFIDIVTSSSIEDFKELCLYGNLQKEIIKRSGLLHNEKK